MVDFSHLPIGREGRAELIVDDAHTAPRVGSGRVRVLATPVVINLMEAAALDAVEGRRLRFEVEARDEKETIGGGTHERVVVNVARFDERVQKKLGDVKT